MTTKTLDSPTKTPTHEELGITHIAFLHDLTKALCGKELKGIACPNVSAECVVCAEIEASMKREIEL